MKVTSLGDSFSEWVIATAMIASEFHSNRENDFYQISAFLDCSREFVSNVLRETTAEARDQPLSAPTASYPREKNSLSTLNSLLNYLIIGL